MNKAGSSLGKPLKRAQDNDIRKLRRERNRLRGRVKTLKAEIASYRDLLEELVDLQKDLPDPGRERAHTDFASYLLDNFAGVAKQRLEDGRQYGKRILEAIQFYADPETYFAVGFFPDNPAGEFTEDFSNTGDLGWKPGKRARVALGWEDEDDAS